ncbi:beta-lactamase family protein [candidate division KSB1 bacterium]|nr:beta-lactamase family protein [candidate division KSB1 bacterium]
MNNFSFLALAFLFLSSAAGAQEERINGWEISKESYNREKISQLKNNILDGTYKEINSVIVVKNNKLLIEEYFNGAGRNTTHDARSVGKTFASAVTGIALQEGYLKNIDQTLSEFYDLKKYRNFNEGKAKVTLKNLLTMSSGFDGFDFDEKSIGNEENMYPQPDWVAWTLNLPMATDREPGQKWYYFTAGVVLLGDILNETVPGGLEKYADAKLFKPLGIENYQWQYTPQHVPNTAGGIRLTPLDFAKFGQLYKNNGKWNGRQILPEEWVAQSFTKHYATTNEGESYGYLWWNKTYQANGKPCEVYYCSGNGGNKIFVFTEHPIVVVVTASAYNRRYAHPQVDEMMQSYIIPAVIED